MFFSTYPVQLENHRLLPFTCGQFLAHALFNWQPFFRPSGDGLSQSLCLRGGEGSGNAKSCGTEEIMKSFRVQPLTNFLRVKSQGFARGG